MKKSVLLFFLGFSFVLSAQVTNEGIPESWKKSDSKTLEAIVMPSFDLKALQEEDVINDQMNDRPWRFGKEFTVNYDINNSGEWTELENGDRMWRIRFQSEGAVTMNFIFDDFYLPFGATLYLYNNDRTDLLGAYTHIENNSERMLGTWIVDGEDVWIEYFEPEYAAGEGNLQIGTVVHGYRNQSPILIEKGLNDSGNCNHDVDCPIDDDLEEFKDVNKHSVAFLMMSGYICSGTLINNTAQDSTPYFLTANHCNAGNTATWSFRFNWISPVPVCAATTNSPNGPMNFVMSGSQTRASRAQSDVRLLELNNPIPEAWNLVWAGWDNSDVAPSKTFGIHHPNGDIMKVCVDRNAPSALNNNGQVWRIHNWELGVTEGGSSGSALFDPQGRIIGQLWRGTAQCSGLNPVGYDEYGRFGVSWDTGTTASTRLKDWLDPDDTGVTTLDPAVNPALNVTENNLDLSVAIFPNPSNGIITIDNKSGDDLSFEVYNMLGQIITKGNVNGNQHTLDLSGSDAGLYFVKLTNQQSGASITKKVILR